MVASHKVDWADDSSVLLLNPRLDPKEAKSLELLTELNPLRSHIWIASSGSSVTNQESVKLMALSKTAFLASARAVNLHLKSDSRDIWVQALPVFHVGGIAIEVRSFLSQAKLVFGLKSDQWDPEFFCQVLEKEKGSLTALVPTQVFDLIRKFKKPPKSLRAVIVGGGALSQNVYEQALELGWPLLPSYGMTECCSQVATADVEVWKEKNREMKLLSHIEAQVTAESFLKIRSPSLLTGFAQWQDGKASWTDPKDQDGWYLTQDQVEIKNGRLIVIGRGSDFVKISGEGVNLGKLQSLLEDLAQKELPSDWKNLAVVAIPDERSQFRIALAVAGPFGKKIDFITENFNQKVAPYEKIRIQLQAKEIPRSPLGKILREKIQF